MLSSQEKVFLLTVDVEDWFQVENFRECIPFASWSSRDLRVERNTHRLLDLLDSVNRQSTNGIGPDKRVQGTFFVLGWLAERLPNLVREIRERGHEVASHGYYHELCSSQSCQALEKELSDSKKLLEDTIGESVYGYRAPSFSVSDDVLKSIEKCGYLYDSSYNSFAMHGRYGKISLNRNGKSGTAYRISDDFYELPISNLPFFPFPTLGILVHFRHFSLPWGGGGYFRLTPGWVFRKGVRKILSDQGVYLFYMHPWEIDPEQPRVQDAAWSFRFRHYVNLGKTERKLSDMLQHFSDCRFLTCHQYLKEIVTREI